MLSSNRLRTNSIGAHMYRSRPGGRKYRRTGAKSACFRFLQFGIAWCKVRSSSYWSQSSRRTSNRDRLDIVPRGQLMKRNAASTVGFEHHLQQMQHVRIIHPPCHLGQEPIMSDIVKVATQIDVYDTCFLLNNCSGHSVDRFM